MSQHHVHFCAFVKKRRSGSSEVLWAGPAGENTDQPMKLQKPAKPTAQMCV